MTILDRRQFIHLDAAALAGAVLTPTGAAAARPVDDRLRIVRSGEEVAPRIRSVPSPGLTPGHISVTVDAGEAELLLSGDAITNTHAAFKRPEWHQFVDIDRDEGARTRRRLLDRAAADEMLILRYHLPIPVLGEALRYADA